MLGVSAFWFLGNRPANAKWLPPDEKQALVGELEREERPAAPPAPRIWCPCCAIGASSLLAVYFLIQMSTYGAIFYLPAQISGSSTNRRDSSGRVSAIPWLCATAATYWLPRLATAKQPSPAGRPHLFVAGWPASRFPPRVRSGLLMLSVAVSGFVAVQPLFWTFPTAYFADRANAGGIALIGVGNLGGFLAPNLKVWADRYFHSPSAGLYVLAGITVFNAGLIAVTKTGPPRARE